MSAEGYIEEIGAVDTRPLETAASASAGVDQVEAAGVVIGGSVGAVVGLGLEHYVEGVPLAADPTQQSPLDSQTHKSVPPGEHHNGSAELLHVGTVAAPIILLAFAGAAVAGRVRQFFAD